MLHLSKHHFQMHNGFLLLLPTHASTTPLNSCFFFFSSLSIGYCLSLCSSPSVTSCSTGFSFFQFTYCSCTASFAPLPPTSLASTHATSLLLLLPKHLLLPLPLDAFLFSSPVFSYILFTSTPPLQFTPLYVSLTSSPPPPPPPHHAAASPISLHSHVLCCFSSCAPSDAAASVPYGSARLVYCCVLMERVMTGSVVSLPHYETCKCVEGQVYFD